MEPAIPAVRRLQTYALERLATGIDCVAITYIYKNPAKKIQDNSAFFSYGEHAIFDVHAEVMPGICNAAS
jgi:hypothetical protein